MTLYLVLAPKYRFVFVLVLLLAMTLGILRSTQAGASDNISGNGSNESPYTSSQCDTLVGGICFIQFNGISLKGWSSGYVPAYQCPGDYEWLDNVNYSPGRLVPNGVKIEEHGTIGVNISGVSTDFGKTEQANGKTYRFYYQTGTKTGGLNSAATNWEIDGGTYFVALYCSSRLSDASLQYIDGPNSNHDFIARHS
jgi:hypothetical protein